MSPSCVHEFCWGLYLGMRLDVTRESEVLLVNEGSDGTGEPEDRGCETQSSERESSHAWSIATL
jgi:hypothetical protein